jgi:TetR/AcrR family transcriptional repressor of nem operon
MIERVGAETGLVKAVLSKWLSKEVGMKVTKEQLAENRSALLAAASFLFRERGIDGVGVSEICKRAGLTHGALYAHFPDKEALAAEALAVGMTEGRNYLAARRGGKPPAFSRYLNYYLSLRTRDDIPGTCALTASASEVARHDESVSASFSEGFEGLANDLQATLNKTDKTAATDRQRALAITAALVGGMAIARGLAKADPSLSKELLEALRQVVGGLGGDPTTEP